MENRSERYAALGVFFASFAVYLLTLAPDITFWDSGELAYGAATLGIPHPPAYPVFCMLGKVFYLLLPFGNAAYRLNLMSAFFGSLTVWLMFVIMLRLVPRGPAHLPVCVSAALLLAFTGPFWAQAVVTEVYTINSLLLASLAYFLLRYEQQGGEAWLHASAFVLGLAFATHQSALLLVPVYVLYYAWAGGVRREPRRAFVSVFFSVLGYSVILYAPVRATTHPPINVGDPEVLHWFKWMLKISEHTYTIKTIPQKIATLAGGEAALPLAGGAAACLAVAWVLRKRPYYLLLVFSAAAYYAGIRILNAGNADAVKWGLLNKFYIPVLLFGIPAGAAAAGRVLGGLFGREGRAGRAAAFAFAAWALLCLPAVSLWHNYRQVDNSNNFFAYDWGCNTLKSVMQDGVLFARGDNGVFPLWYLQGQERYRDDVLTIHTELLTHTWYMNDIFDRIQKKYNVVLEKPSNPTRLKQYMPVLKFVLEKRTPTYFDYSAASVLGIKLEKLWPQGLIHLVKSWKPVNLGRIWLTYEFRGALDGSTNKAFAAEGTLGIYAYECGIWAQQAYQKGKPQEALMAYDLMTELGGPNEYMDTWAAEIRKQLATRRRN